MNRTRTPRPTFEPEVGRFADRLAEVIGERSLRSFAREAGVSETVLRKYVAGDSEPTRPALIAMAAAGNVAVGWLASGAETALQSHSQPVRLHVETLREATRSLIRVCAAYGFAYDPVEDVDLLAEFYAEGMEEDGEISAENVIRLVERIAERRREQEKRRGGTNGEEAEGVGRRAAGKGARQG